MLTLLIVISTAAFSYFGFQKPELMSRYDFSPYRITHRNEYYRFFTHAFLHADWVHLLINMLVFFSFGSNVEQTFNQMAEVGYIRSGEFNFILLYGSSIIISSLVTFLKKRNDPYYSAVGASGAVSAILFTSIFFSPLENVYLYAVIPLPGIVFGILYLAYSSYMGKKGKDNINHDAHFWGAIFGLIFPVLMEPSLLQNFLFKIGIN
jgi:membrane associated rhomboid family serine protease